MFHHSLKFKASLGNKSGNMIEDKPTNEELRKLLFEWGGQSRKNFVFTQFFLPAKDFLKSHTFALP